MDSEDEIICDLAETYHILNYQELPPSLVATLVLGLHDDSRIKRKITGCKLTLEQMLMASMVDNLQFISWTKTKAAQKGHSRPESVLNKLLGSGKKNPNDELMSFESPAEYEEWRRKKREEWENGGNNSNSLYTDRTVN